MNMSFPTWLSYLIQKTFWFHIIGSYCHSCLYGSIYLTSISTLVGIRFNKLQYSNWIISNSIQISIIQISNDWNKNNICWKTFLDFKTSPKRNTMYHDLIILSLQEVVKVSNLQNTVFLCNLSSSCIDNVVNKTLG